MFNSVLKLSGSLSRRVEAIGLYCSLLFIVTGWTWTVPTNAYLPNFPIMFGWFYLFTTLQTRLFIMILINFTLCVSFIYYFFLLLLFLDANNDEFRVRLGLLLVLMMINASLVLLRLPLDDLIMHWFWFWRSSFGSMLTSKKRFGFNQFVSNWTTTISITIVEYGS